MSKDFSFVPIRPGVTIKEHLEIKKMSRKKFARKMGLSENKVNFLIEGGIQIDEEMAKKLEKTLGLSVSFWMELETVYQEEKLLMLGENKRDEGRK